MQEEAEASGYEAAVANLPPTKRKNVRATMRDGSGLMLEPLPPVEEGGPVRTRASLVVHMEPKMYMPGWLVKWFLGQFCCCRQAFLLLLLFFVFVFVNFVEKQWFTPLGNSLPLLHSHACAAVSVVVLGLVLD